MFLKFKGIIFFSKPDSLLVLSKVFITKKSIEPKSGIILETNQQHYKI